MNCSNKYCKILKIETAKVQLFQPRFYSEKVENHWIKAPNNNKSNSRIIACLFFPINLQKFHPIYFSFLLSHQSSDFLLISLILNVYFNCQLSVSFLYTKIFVYWSFHSLKKVTCYFISLRNFVSTTKNKFRKIFFSLVLIGAITSWVDPGVLSVTSNVTRERIG